MARRSGGGCCGGFGLSGVISAVGRRTCWRAPRRERKRNHSTPPSLDTTVATATLAAALATTQAAIVVTVLVAALASVVLAGAALAAAALDPLVAGAVLIFLPRYTQGVPRGCAVSGTGCCCQSPAATCSPMLGAGCDHAAQPRGGGSSGRGVQCHYVPRSMSSQRAPRCVLVCRGRPSLGGRAPPALDMKPIILYMMMAI